MRNKTLLSFLSIIFFSFLLIGQNIAQDKAALLKNIGKFSVSKNGTQRDLQGASTALITGTDIGSNIHFKHPYNSSTMHVFAGTFKGSLDGNKANFYCIDIGHGLVFNQGYTDEGPTQNEITYVLNNYYPYASYPYAGSASTKQREAAAVQAVMWHYADGMDLSSIKEDEVRKRALAIAEDADANAGSVTYPDYFTISPSALNLLDGTVGNFTISAYDTDGNPFEGMDIDLSTTSGLLSVTHVTTDANGTATFALTQNGGTSATITATAQAVIPQGTKYFHKTKPNEKQKLVLATPTVATSLAETEVSWYQYASLGNFVWNDENENGIQDIGELGVANVTVKLFSCDDVELDTTTTDANGNYLFNNLMPDDYYVKFILPNGYTFSLQNQVADDAIDSDADQITGKTECTTLISGENDLTWDAGINLTKASLGNKVWYDTDENGIQGEGEQGVPNVTVKLFNCADVELSSTTTDGNGHYLFGNLVPGDYYVKFILPSGHVFTAKNAGIVILDSDADVVSGKTVCTTLEASENDLTWDAGIYQSKAGLGDFVWNDTNNNGIQDQNEVGISGVTVKLYSCANVLLGTEVTDTNGYYLFSELDAGDYFVKFILPTNYLFSPKNQGENSALDSDANTSTGKTICTTLVPGEIDRSWDAGMYQCFNTIGNYIWHDSNVNGIQDVGENGIEDVVVELYDAGNTSIATTTTNISGKYEFTGVPNGTYKVKVADANFNASGVFEGSVSEKWYLTYANKGNSDELDSDGDTSKSAKVTVNCDNDETIDFGFFRTCMTFIKSGPQSITAGDIINYTFTVINCGDIVLHGGATVYDPMLNPNGNHKIRNAVVQPGATWEFTASYTTDEDDCGTLVNNAWVIGDPQMPDGSYKEDIRYDDSHSVEVVCNQKASLGDRVWYDINENGIQDFGEDGVKDVTVNLYNCADLFITSTTTDNDGYYLFDNLESGSYYVEFVLSNGYLFTTQNAGSDSALDSDADETTGKTVCTDLIAGEVDLTWDAGIYVESVNDFDLSIVKSASNTNPDDEALVTYRITITNNSSTDGTGITVSDVLPAGLIYQSSNPAGYNNVTGIWNVGDIDAGDSKSLDITVKVDYLNLGEAPIFDLGVAAPFNLFVLKDVVQPSSDTEGKVAVGRNATFGGYSIGDKLPLSGGTEDVLIVGRKLTYTSGQVYSGNVVYGKYIDVQQINLCSDGSIRKENPVPVDFAQAKIELNALSSQLATRAATGTTTFEWGGLTLTGTEPILNVFEVDGNDLSAANNMQIDVPNGSVVLVNINRKDVTWTGGLTVNGTAIGNVLYNFHRATKLRIQGIDIRGSVLAPKAKVNFVTGVINGQMICRFFEGQGQMNNSLFHGSIYGNPEITNCAEIQSYDQVDVDLSNNISCDPIVVNVDYNPNNGDDSNDGSKWVEFGGTSLNEMIWSMYQGNNGLYIGTVGGNIYLNNGTDYELLNEDMAVTYIWSLYEFNGSIYAATELGLYSYNGTDWTKVAIDGDVRSITSLNGVLYAAVWGVGVFASSDNGTTWTTMNNGLMMSGYAVQTLTVTNNSLFVGTLALGVLKYDFTLSTWVELPVGYQFIWALATDVDFNIYAATSGGGVYLSTDDGESWMPINTGLPNMHIYSVSVYGNDVYISTWSGGVYKYVTSSPSLSKSNSGSASIASTPVTGSWSSLGMGGIEVSSIMVDETTKTLYAGTSSGTIYKKLDGVTDVNSIETMPTEFGLEQNYPNPFNPSTKIEFSIAEAGLYAVKVFNVLGQEVAIVANQDFAAGKYTFNFDASNLTSGIYFYKLIGNKVNMTKKMMLLK